MAKWKVLIAAIIALSASLVLFSGVTAAQESAITVEEAAIATSVQDRQPVGVAESFSADVGRLYCFTKLVGIEHEKRITHKWYWGEKLMAEVELSVGSGTWRTWSAKKIAPSWTGEWKVVVEGPDGAELTSITFVVE